MNRNILLPVDDTIRISVQDTCSVAALFGEGWKFNPHSIYSWKYENNCTTFYLVSPNAQKVSKAKCSE